MASIEDKPDVEHHEMLKDEGFHDAAERGHAATDRYVAASSPATPPLVDQLSRYGNALVHFDPKAESRLRWKIDLMIVPTVALLYLFCFIDRANIGYHSLTAAQRLQYI